jgi:uncharacterized protein with PIN domain
VAKAEVVDTLPPNVRQGRQRFSTCCVCQRVFWEGSHWQHMHERLALAVAAAAPQEKPA